MPLPRADVEQTLAGKLGFTPTDADHRRFRLEIGGEVVARTMTSHGTQYRELGEQLIREMARQLHVSRDFFVALVRCIKMRDDYLAELRRCALLD